jgi:heme exporter protein C
MVKPIRHSATFFFLCFLCAVGFAIAPYLIFFVAPVHHNLGFIQKIFYFHVPCAWAMFLSAILSAIGGAASLLRQKRWGDELCISAAELTWLFGILVLITGPLWAKKTWGHYWVWDVRLTTVLVLFLVFIAVLLARRYGGPARKKICAALAIFGAAEVPFVYFSVKFWRATHPKTTVVASLPDKMKLAFFVSLALFTVVLVLLLWIRINLERCRNHLDDAIVLATEEE